MRACVRACVRAYVRACVCVCVCVCLSLSVCLSVCLCDKISVFLCLCKGSRFLRDGAPKKKSFLFFFNYKSLPNFHALISTFDVHNTFQASVVDALMFGFCCCCCLFVCLFVFPSVFLSTKQTLKETKQGKAARVTQTNRICSSPYQILNIVYQNPIVF